VSRIGLLDLATGKVERWLWGPEGIGGLAFSNDGKKLVATTYSEHPDRLEKVKHAEGGTSGWLSAHGSSRTGFFLPDLAAGGGIWREVSHDSDVLGRSDFAFTRDDKGLFARVVGDKDGMEKFYDLEGDEVAAPGNEKHLRWDVPARLSPNGKLAALGLTKEVAPGKSYSSISDPRTGKEITKVRGGQLLAWVDDKRLIVWERASGLDQPYKDRLVLVTIGSDKVVPLSGVREQAELERPPWQPVFAER
jgi:hypothetical protein